MSERGFWGCTPAQFRALLRRFEAKLFREDWRTGLLAAIQVNANRKSGARAAKPTDFIPGYVEPQRAAQSKEAALMFMQAFKAAHLAKKEKESKAKKKRHKSNMSGRQAFG